MGQRIGYRRVSTLVQNTARQLEDVDIDKMFEDKLSGSTRARPGLEAMLDHLRAGDEVHVHSIDRLARDLGDLHAIVRDITERGAVVHFHKESLMLGGGDTAIHRLQLDIMGAVAAFERAIINERSAEGRAIARQKGVRFGAAPKLSKAEQRKVCQQYQAGEPVSRIAIDLDVSRRTIHRVLERAGVERRSNRQAARDG